MWKKLVTMHQDLQIHDSHLWKNLEQYFIKDLSATMNDIIASLDQLDSLQPYLDVYSKTYIQRFAVYLSSFMKQSSSKSATKYSEVWSKRIDKCRTQVYIKSVAAHIFDFLKMMQDDEVAPNVVRILEEVKKICSSGDVIQVDGRSTTSATS